MSELCIAKCQVQNVKLLFAVFQMLYNRAMKDNTIKPTYHSRHNGKYKPEIKYNAYPNYYHGKGPLCDAVIVLSGRYDIGLQLDKTTKKYKIIADNELMGGQYLSDNYGINDLGRKICGEGLANLLKTYHIENIKLDCQKRNRKVEFLNRQDGSVKAIITKRRGV